MATSDELYEASYGTVKLWASSVQTDNGRDQVIKRLSRGDVHPLQDRGLKPRTTRVVLLFDEMLGESKSGNRRFREFKQLVDEGEPQLFRHPIDGSYLAAVGEFEYTIDESGILSPVNVEFIASEEIRPVSPASAGVASSAGETVVSQAADNLNADLESVGISSTVADDAVAAQQSWTPDTGDVPIRQILVDTAALIDQVSGLIDDNDLEGDLALFDPLRSAIVLADSVRAAALAATAETSALFVLKIASPVSLLALCVRIYGGRDADDRMRQILSLNDVRTPGWLPVGLELTCPDRSISPRATL